MVKNEKFEHPIGVVFDDAKGRQVTGQLNLKQGGLFDSNVVSISDKKPFHLKRGDDLQGVSKAGRVSLLDCVRGGILGMTGWGDFAMHHGDIAFRYALFGKQHVRAGEKCIRGIQFTLEGIESSVFADERSEKFGFIHDPDEDIIDAIKQKGPDYLQGDFVKGQAMLFYFTGAWEVIPRHETVLGHVSVRRTMQGDIFGLKIEDTLVIEIDFDDAPTTLEGAWKKMRQVRQFFGWMMGYAPAWKDVFVFTSMLDDDGIRTDDSGRLEVYGPSEWKEVPESTRHYGSLIHATRNPDHFMEVMAKWLERNSDERRKSANARFFGCLQGTTDRVIEDGIVSAANTFDLLPNEDKPEAEPLPGDVAQVLADAKQEIKRTKSLAKHDKADILSALSRIRANKPLRDIVKHRAAEVLSHFSEEELKDLEKVIRLAVKCRNHYTHGPETENKDNVDFSDFGVVLFLTRSLEFIYCASELLLCGWDSKTSAADAWHPIEGYVKYYDQNRAVLGLE